MYIINPRSVDDLSNMVLFILFRTFFDDIYNFFTGFINIKKIDKNNYKYDSYSLCAESPI